MIERKASKVIQREVDARRAAEAEMQRYQTVAEGVRRDVTNLQVLPRHFCGAKILQREKSAQIKKPDGVLKPQRAGATRSRDWEDLGAGKAKLEAGSLTTALSCRMRLPSSLTARLPETTRSSG